MLAELLELAPQGFEQVDGDGFVEFGVYGAPGELPEPLTGAAHVRGIEVCISTTQVGEDWLDRWREFHKPARIGRVQIRAPWHPPAADGVDVVIPRNLSPRQSELLEELRTSLTAENLQEQADESLLAKVKRALR